MEPLDYQKVANILLHQSEPISIEKLSVISSITTKELEAILSYFNSLGFLEFKNDFNRIKLNSKAKQSK